MTPDELDDEDVIYVGRGEVRDGDTVHVRHVGPGSMVLPERMDRRLTPDQRRAVAMLQTHARNLEQLRNDVEACVYGAREERVPWSVISWSLGLTESAARKRWGERGIR